ncbi:hypothetical protein KI387_032258, partial [Taxus chinensis]
MNKILRKGCEELNYEVHNIPCNVDPKHYCWWCCFGYKDRKKQGMHETWLVEAMNHNALILVGCRAVAVIQDKNGGTGRKKKAVGVMFCSRLGVEVDQGAFLIWKRLWNRKGKKQNQTTTVKCEWCVVGSGSGGGGVVCRVLAKARHRVIVVEKGKYFARRVIPLLEGPIVGSDIRSITCVGAASFYKDRKKRISMRHAGGKAMITMPYSRRIASRGGHPRHWRHLPQKKAVGVVIPDPNTSQNIFKSNPQSLLVSCGALGSPL